MTLTLIKYYNLTLLQVAIFSDVRAHVRSHVRKRTCSEIIVVRSLAYYKPGGPDDADSKLKFLFVRKFISPQYAEQAGNQEKTNDTTEGDHDFELTPRFTRDK